MITRKSKIDNVGNTVVKLPSFHFSSTRKEHPLLFQTFDFTRKTKEKTGLLITHSLTSLDTPIHFCKRSSVSTVSSTFSTLPSPLPIVDGTGYQVRPVPSRDVHNRQVTNLYYAP